MVQCSDCNLARAVCKSPQTGCLCCKECFSRNFEETVHRYIEEKDLFQPGEVIGIGVSGGKDSTVLLHVLHVLALRYSYPVTLVMLAVDEGIAGYRDESLASVYRNQKRYGHPLSIIPFTKIVGCTLDTIAAQTARKNCCTHCGILRRHALTVGAREATCTLVVTGHNADDCAETVLLNMFRGDAPRLVRCTDAKSDFSVGIPRAKPFQCVTQKEIVLYAHFNRLDYFSTECPYAETAFRGAARALLAELAVSAPRVALDVIGAADELRATCTIGPARSKREESALCPVCGDPASSRCHFCELKKRIDAGFSDGPRPKKATS
eukprot:gnl/Chilomastix_cuspidata/695.p1 GENE.gnl/Chilomastix_cuspidata/695~~gnl/Chilomastix_cuspidata/695.p1  ORF type:complete len:322 (-),score=59.92 gnl/Chilomastix_cuspidata/695:18-983(-)